VKPRANLIGDRRPHRTLADVGGVVEHVIEHAMTLRADIIPVGRIERRALFGLQRLIALYDSHAARSCCSLARRSSMTANASNTLRI
jgi:hypothetical protein